MFAFSFDSYESMFASWGKRWTNAGEELREEMESKSSGQRQWVPGQNWRDWPLVRAGPGEKKMGKGMSRINDSVVRQ